MRCQDNKSDETLDNWRKRLIFRSNYRGIKELDLIMGSFVDQNVNGFNAVELREYEKLLHENDVSLYNWLTGAEIPPENIFSSKMFQKLQKHRFV